MLKNIETDETIGFFYHIFIIGRISIGGGPGSIPLAAPMSRDAGPEKLHQGVVK